MEEKQHDRPPQICRPLVDNELARVEARVRSVENSLPSLQREMHSGFSEIKEALAKIDARPTGGMKEFMGYIRDFAITIGLIVTGIVYVAGTHWAAPIALVQDKVDRLEMSAFPKENYKLQSRISTLEKQLSWIAQIEKGDKK